MDEFTSIAKFLRDKGFTHEYGEYVDPFHGRVMDFFRDDERITCILSKNRGFSIHSYVDGKIYNKNFVEYKGFWVLDYLSELLKE